MAGFWVGIKGDLTAERREALKTGGIVVDDLRLISAGYGTPPQWETMRTCVHVPAVDEAGARTEVARALGVDAGDLLAFSAEVFRWRTGLTDLREEPATMAEDLIWAPGRPGGEPNA
jgi:hypothetical protein